MRFRCALTSALVLTAVTTAGVAAASPASGGSSGYNTGESTPAPVYGYSTRQVTRRVNTDQRTIALTLDDGFHPDPRILDLVQTWGLRGTAFIVGTVARDNPAFVHRLVDLGWEVCSHTWDHAKLTTLTDYQIYREMSRGMHEVRKVSGQSCPYFRPPYGDVDSRVIATADSLGLKVINWDASLSDITTPGMDPRIQVAVAFQYLRPGSILLGHWGAVNSYEVLKAVLTAVLAAGYKVGTVTDLLEAGGITPPAAAVTPSPQPSVAAPAPAANPVSIVAPSTIPLHADGTRVTVVRVKHASATVGFVRLTGAIAALFVVLLLFRSRGRRRRAEKSAKRKLADQREPEHSYRR